MEQKIVEMRQDVSTLQTKVAMLDQSQTSLKEVVNRDTARMDGLIDTVGGMDTNIAILLERVGSNTADTKQNEAWIRDNWTKIVELGAIITFVTKSLGIW